MSDDTHHGFPSALDEIDRLRALVARYESDNFGLGQVIADVAALNAETFHAIRRADGDLIYGEYSWMAADGPDDWTVAEESDHDDPTDYEIVLMHVQPIARRTFGPPPVDDDE